MNVKRFRIRAKERFIGAIKDFYAGSFEYGSVNMNSAPVLCLEITHILPPRSSIYALQMESPSPVPPN